MRYMPDVQRGIAYPFYQRVGRELALRGWTHVELQRRSGVARSTVTKWATGQQPPLPGSVNAVADVLGISRAEALRLAGILTDAPDVPGVPLTDDELDAIEAESGADLSRLSDKDRRILLTWIHVTRAAAAERGHEDRRGA